MSWWITVSEHMLEQSIPGAPPHQVREFYVDLDKLKTLHPFLQDAQRLERTELPDGYRQRYRIRERIPFGPLPIGIRFIAELTVPDHGPVTSVSRQFPHIALDSTMSFDADGPGTHVVEHLTITAPTPLHAFTVRGALEAHTMMLAGISRHF